MNWSDLPAGLRTVLGTALLLVIGVAVASFYLSFIALREVAGNHITGWGQYAWVFPLCVDAALVACEVVLIGASMVKGANRAIPFVLMCAFGALTIGFNVMRVPAAWRLVTGTPPAAGILMTLLIAYLVKLLARVTGTAWEHQAPPPAYRVLGTPGSPIQGAVWRPEAPPYQVPPAWMPYGQMPSPTTSENGHNGLSDASKRERIRAYLSRLSGRPAAFQVATGSSIVEALAIEEGITVSVREANRELDAYRSELQQVKHKR